MRASILSGFTKRSRKAGSGIIPADEVGPQVGFFGDTVEDVALKVDQKKIINVAIVFFHRLKKVCVLGGKCGIYGALDIGFQTLAAVFIFAVKC